MAVEVQSNTDKGHAKNITTLCAEIADMKLRTKHAAMSPSTLKNGDEYVLSKCSNFLKGRTSKNEGDAKEMKGLGTPESFAKFIRRTLITDYKQLTYDYQVDDRIFETQFFGHGFARDDLQMIGYFLNARVNDDFQGKGVNFCFWKLEFHLFLARGPGWPTGALSELEHLTENNHRNSTKNAIVLFLIKFCCLVERDGQTACQMLAQLNVNTNPEKLWEMILVEMNLNPKEKSVVVRWLCLEQTKLAALLCALGGKLDFKESLPKVADEQNKFPQLLNEFSETASKLKSISEEEAKDRQMGSKSQDKMNNIMNSLPIATSDGLGLYFHSVVADTRCFNMQVSLIKSYINDVYTLENKIMNIADYTNNTVSEHHFEQQALLNSKHLIDTTVTPEGKKDPFSVFPSKGSKPKEGSKLSIEKPPKDHDCIHAVSIADIANRNIQTSDTKVSVGKKRDSDESSKIRSQTPESEKHDVEKMPSEQSFCGSSSNESSSQLSNRDDATSTTIDPSEPNVGVENKPADPAENSKTRLQMPESENLHNVEKMSSGESSSETSSDESSSQPSNMDGATSTTVDPSEPDSHENSKTRSQMPESETPHDIEKMPSMESFSEASSDESSSQPSNMDGATSTTVDPISYRINPKVDETRELVQATPVPSRLDPKLLHRHDVPDVHQTVPSSQPVLDPKQAVMSPDWLFHNRLMPGVDARPNPAPASEGPEPPPLTGEALRRAMAQANYRTASMIHLQHQLDVPAMVEAGLYLDESDEDVIRCYECDLNVPRADWPADQDPREHHRQLSPNCRLVRCHHDEANGQPSWSPDGAESVRPPPRYLQQDLTVDGDDDDKVEKSDDDDDEDGDDGDKCVH